jgi:hypothetical protein
VRPLGQDTSLNVFLSWFIGTRTPSARLNDRHGVWEQMVHPHPFTCCDSLCHSTPPSLTTPSGTSPEAGRQVAQQPPLPGQQHQGLRCTLGSWPAAAADASEHRAPPGQWHWSIPPVHVPLTLLLAPSPCNHNMAWLLVVRLLLLQ